MTIEDPLVSVDGYQLLPIATSQLMDNNREFDVSGIIGRVSLIFYEGSLYPLKIYHSMPMVTNCYPSNQSVSQW